MVKILEVQRQLVPQMVELMERRYLILRQIRISQPIGRRSLSNMLNISERVIRTETDFLRDKNLITVEISGMKITEAGNQLLIDLKAVMEEIMEIPRLEESLKNKLGIKKVIVVSGNYEKNSTLIKDVAAYATQYFFSVLKDGDIISVTGGSTIKEFSEALKPTKVFKDLVVTPARGSFGTDVETQSNSIASSVSKSLKSKLELLTIPDELEDEAKETMVKIPGIKHALDAIKNTNILVFSIGRADVMAERRNLPQDLKEKLIKGKAVGEAFGYYFDSEGNIIHKLSTVGIDLETYKNIKENIMIFAGSEKVDAFLAVSRVNSNFVLVTDESSAKVILEKIN